MIRNKLPLFKSRSIFKKVIAWTISFVILIIGFSITNSALGQLHTPEYIVMKQERTKKEAEERAKRDIEKQAELARKAEEKAKMDAEKTAAKEVEEKNKLAKAQEKEAEENAKKEAELLAKEQEKTEKANKKMIDAFESALKKGDSKNIINIYNSSNDQVKKYIEEKLQTAYLEEIKQNKESIISKDFDKLQKLYEKMKFINDIPILKNSNIGNILTDLKGMMEANTNLADFKKSNPKLSSGNTVDISQAQTIKCYVNYRIKNAGWKIGDLSIQNDSYTDKYFISSYSYNQLFGYTPTDEWQATLILSKDSKITESGVYSINMVQIGKTSLIDSQGFEKEYPLYREVSQEDVDKYNEIEALLDQQYQLESKIDEYANRISQRLSGIVSYKYYDPNNSLNELSLTVDSNNNINGEVTINTVRDKVALIEFGGVLNEGTVQSDFEDDGFGTSGTIIATFKDTEVVLEIESTSGSNGFGVENGTYKFIKNEN